MIEVYLPNGAEMFKAALTNGNFFSVSKPRGIRAAYEPGYNFFDTAECYTGENPDGSTSNNKEIVVEALKDVRDKVVIATKFGVAHNSDRSLTLDSSPATIRKAARR